MGLGTLELREYLRVLHKSWLLVLVSTLLGIGIAAGSSLLATPQYESRTKLFVSVQAGETASSGDLVQGSTFARQIVGSFVDVVTSGVVLDPVVQELGLDMTGADLAEHISASSPANSVLLNISATSPSPEQAAQIADAVRESFTRVVNQELAPDRPSGTSPIRLTMTQPALVPDVPVSPNTKLNLVLGVLVGLSVGVGLAILRSVLDTRIHSLHDIEQITDKPLLGGIVDDPSAAKNPLVADTDPHSPRAESFRALRTNLQFLNVGGHQLTYVITSPGPGEGKTTTAVNLALSLAQTGASVALVEADLRLPKASEYLGIEVGAGLTDVLIGNAEIDDVMHRWGRNQLHVVPAGRTPPNPSELLGSTAMDQVLDVLNRRFDYVLIDSPPTLMVTDAAVIGKKTAGLLMVVASGSTKKHALEGAARTLDTAGADLLGVIVTMLAAKGPDSYGYGNYGYGGYGDTPDYQPEADGVYAGRRAKGRMAKGRARG